MIRAVVVYVDVHVNVYNHHSSHPASVLDPLLEYHTTPPQYHKVATTNVDQRREPPRRPPHFREKGSRHDYAAPI